MNQNLLVVLIQQHLLALLKELSSQSTKKLLDYYEDAERNAGVSTELNLPVPTLATLVVGDIRKEIFQCLEETITVHRVFLTLGSEIKYEVGWVLNEDVAVCMICCRYFYRLSEQFATKHHCGACGNIVCDHCSASVAVVAGLEAFGEQRVCLSCDYGQSLVEASPNNKNGVSLVHIPAISTISGSTDKETDDTSEWKSFPEEEPISDVTEDSLDGMTEANRIYQEKVDFLQTFISPKEKLSIEKITANTASSFKSLPLTEYGPSDLLTVTPHTVLKCYYAEKPDPNAVPSLHQIQNARRLFTVVQELLWGIELSNHSNTFVYVNVCTTDAVPMDSQKFSYQKTKKTWISEELYPLVFNPLAEKYQGISVIDVAVNPAYVTNTEEGDVQKQQAFEEQLLNGLSLLFPTIQFIRCEQVTGSHDLEVITPRHLKKRQAKKKRLSVNELVDDLHDRLDTEQVKENHPNYHGPMSCTVQDKPGEDEAPVRMILPSEEAMLVFRYTYVSMTSLILQTTESHLREPLDRPQLVSLQKEFTSNLVRLLTYRKEKVVNEEKAKLLLQELHPQSQQQQQQHAPSHHEQQQQPSTPSKMVTFAPALVVDTKVKPPFIGLKIPSPITEEMKKSSSSDNKEESTTSLDDTKSHSMTTSTTAAAKRVLMRKRSSLTIDKKQSLVRSLSSSSFTSSLDLSMDTAPELVKQQSSYSPTSWEMMKQSLKRSPNAGMVVPKLTISPTNGSHRFNLSQHLTADHFKFIEELRLDTLTADRLKERAKKDPDLLIGWQILVYKEKEFLKGLYVITAAAYFPVVGTMFRVSQVEGKDRWLKLGLHEDSKKRLSFQLQRQVITKQEIQALQKV